MSLPINQVLVGNCLEILKSFPSESIDFVQTSPPYWGLRVYGKESEIEWPDGWRGQLGLEPHPNLYIEHLVMIFREVKRVLKRTGSMYVVLGDTFAGSHCGKGDVTLFGNFRRQKVAEILYNKPTPQAEKFNESWLRPKQQLNIPFHVAFALQQDGWLQRARAIWHKPNAMPGSQKDRLTCSYEFIFHFVKNDKTLLWRNMETGEWRTTRPAQQYVKYEGNIRVAMFERPTVLQKTISECSDLEVEERKKWHRLWMGFDYYYELDAIRKPHTSLKDIGRKRLDTKTPKHDLAVSLGAGSIGPSGYLVQHPLGKNPTDVSSFNLRVRDVKRGKGGVSVQGVLKASEKEVENYDYPEGTKHDVAVARGRNVAYTDPLHVKAYGDKGKNPGDVFRDKTADEGFKGPLAVRQAPEPSEPNAFHPLGKNPGDVVGYNSKYFEQNYGQTIQGFMRSQSQFKERLKSRELAKQLFPNDPEKQQAFINYVHDHYSDPKGPNPRDIIKIGMHHGSSLTTGRATHYKGQSIEAHPLGKNPTDILERKFNVPSWTVRTSDPRKTHPRVYEAGSDGRDFWSINTKPFKGAHFAVYPVEICIYPILSSCPPGGVVLDPMCGAGSTLVAAKQLGRKFIGIDINGDYVKLALERLAKITTLDSYLSG